jgi:L-fuculose-phosphate aldolase
MTDLRSALVAGARAVAESGLVVGAAGNLSVRDGDAMLITPRGARLEAIDPVCCVAVDLATEVVDADASSETPLHRAVYAATDAGAIVHTHSTFATVQSTLVDELPAVHYGITAFGGPVRVAPYATFGTPELAANVLDALDGRGGALMASHGAITHGADLATAVDLTLLLEWACTVYWRAAAIGTPRAMDAAAQQAVADAAVARRYGTTRSIEEDG